MGVAPPSPGTSASTMKYSGSPQSGAWFRQTGQGQEAPPGGISKSAPFAVTPVPSYSTVWPLLYWVSDGGVTHGGQGSMGG